MRRPAQKSDEKIRRVFQMRVALFLVFIVLVVVLLSTTYQAAQTLARLDVVERERDHLGRQLQT